MKVGHTIPSVESVRAARFSRPFPHSSLVLIVTSLANLPQPFLSRRQVLCILYDGGKHAQQEKRLLGTVSPRINRFPGFRPLRLTLLPPTDRERPGPPGLLQEEQHRARRHLGQGGPELRVREAHCRCRSPHHDPVPPGLPLARDDREGAEAQDRYHRRCRL